MKHKLCLIVPLIALLSGCVDTMDSLTREFRNCNNEAIDGLSMIVDEQSCDRMNTRVLKPVGDRYKDIERRLDIWKNNRATDRELVEMTFKSDSFYLYVIELQINQERFSLERMRLRNLYKQYLDQELQRMRDAGDPDPIITDPAKLCPKLHEMVTQDKLKPIEQQLTKPVIMQLVATYPGLKGVKKDYPALHQIFVDRMEKFTPKHRHQIVW